MAAGSTNHCHPLSPRLTWDFTPIEPGLPTSSGRVQNIAPGSPTHTERHGSTMATFRIDRIDIEIQGYEIPDPHNENGFVEITVPFWDCQPSADLEELDRQLKEKDLSITNSQGIRHALRYYNPHQSEAIDAMVTRQIVKLGNHWVKTEEGDASGEESSTSGGSSEQKKD